MNAISSINLSVLLYSLTYLIRVRLVQNDANYDWAYRMLNLGMHAHDIIVTKTWKSPRIDKLAKENLMKFITNFIYDDHIHEQQVGAARISGTGSGVHEEEDVKMAAEDEEMFKELL